MSRDVDRAAVYAAEELVFSETLFAEPLGPSGVLDLARLIDEDPWWQRYGVSFLVGPTRREAQHSHAAGTRDGSGGARIQLSIHQEDVATLAHEVAHLLAGLHGADPPHGSVFRAAELDVVTVVCGQAAAARLERGFADSALVVAERRWPAPPQGTPHGIYGRWRLTTLVNRDVPT